MADLSTSSTKNHHLTIVNGLFQHLWYLILIWGAFKLKWDVLALVVPY
jgi:hypothetical protein